jgi:hypothetical protein
MTLVSVSSSKFKTRSSCVAVSASEPEKAPIRISNFLALCDDLRPMLLITISLLWRTSNGFQFVNRLSALTRFLRTGVCGCSRIPHSGQRTR